MPSQRDAVTKPGDSNETNNRACTFYSYSNFRVNCCRCQRNYKAYCSRSFRRINSTICNSHSDKPFSPKAIIHAYTNYLISSFFLSKKFAEYRLIGSSPEHFCLGRKWKGNISCIHHTSSFSEFCCQSS